MSGYVIRSNDNRYYVYDFYKNRYTLESLYNIREEFDLASYNVVCFSSKEKAINFIKENGLKNTSIDCIDCDPDNFLSIIAYFYLQFIKDSNFFDTELKPTLMKDFKDEKEFDEACRKISLDIVKKRMKE